MVEQQIQQEIGLNLSQQEIVLSLSHQKVDLKHSEIQEYYFQLFQFPLNILVQRLMCWANL